MMIGGTDMDESTQRMSVTNGMGHLVFSKTQENLGVMGEVVDTTIKTVIQVEPIKVDKEIKQM